MFFEPRITAIFLVALAVTLAMHWSRVGRALRILFFRIQHPRMKPEP